MTIFIMTICIILLLASGFIGGIFYSAWVMTSKAQKLNDAIWETAGDKLSPEQYQNLRDNAPELLGLKGKNG